MLKKKKNILKKSSKLDFNSKKRQPQTQSGYLKFVLKALPR